MIILKKIGIPSVLGLILGGILINLIIDINSLVTDFFSLEIIITEMALAYIGYKIGNEIDLHVLKEKGTKFGAILLGEALGAFFIISLGLYIFTNNLGLSLILGSIGMATAPAATTSILGEYKAKGELTQTILFIIAFDDTLTILFVGISLGFVAHEGEEIGQLLTSILFELSSEIFLAIIIGLFGILLIIILLKTKLMSKRTSVEWILGTAFILIGFSLLLNISSILVMFIWGLAIKYLEDNSSFSQLEEHMEKVEVLTTPLLSLFFILVGLLMDLNLLLEISTLVFSVLYFLFRAMGKSSGSYITAYYSKFKPSTTNNLPLSLLTQAGIAIGLASLSYRELLQAGRESEATLILNVIGISVIIAEIIGPFLVKKAIFRAGEASLS